MDAREAFRQAIDKNADDPAGLLAALAEDDPGTLLAVAAAMAFALRGVGLFQCVGRADSEAAFAVWVDRMTAASLPILDGEP